ncbi:putative class V chitinase [Colletotrichum kahawae]|uniref:Class V chitinase n=1 Tax=Colletotrichum kahawae TaxID=34407 RepID=A0AAD9YDA2_COLKA|nr:putative class V chitinase [Colletotrichum kahawae]
MRFENLFAISVLTSATAAITLPRRDATFESGTPVTKEITLPDGRTRTATFFAEFTPEDAGWTPSSSFYDLCGGSSFTNNWNSNAPLVDDCQFLQQYFASTGGYFQVENSDLDASGVSWSRLVSINTCGFSVRVNPRPATAGYIGNTDVSDLVRDSISGFSQNSQVSVGGNTGCQDADGGQWHPDWLIQRFT